MQIIKIVLGVISLVFGRKIFWLFVGIAGFLFGMKFSIVIFNSHSLWIQLLVGLGLGIIGSVLAIFFQRMVFALAGFYAGAYLALAGALAYGIMINSTLLLFAGGIIGAIVAALIMDWAIIILSCMVGAGAIVVSIQTGKILSPVIYIALVIIGAAVQGNLLNHVKKHEGLHN